MQNADRKLLVSMRNVSKIFRMQNIETHALSNINLDVREGEYLAIQGRSGSGKSTLLALLGLMDVVSVGAFELFGRDAMKLSRRDCAMLRNRHIGFVFQFFHLIGDLSVEDNIALPMMYAGKTAGDIAKRVDSLLERLGLGARRNHKPSQLSGGQQQRVAIARALVNDPAMLLVDEPTGNLDSDNGAQVMALLAEIQAEGRAICMVTHDAECAAFATRHLIMDDGVLTERATAADPAT